MEPRTRSPRHPSDPPHILVVEANARGRDRIGAWLEQAGYEVLTCPGPSAPSYRCVGSHLGRCSLVEGADAVVLDLHLASDTVGEGTPAWELLLFYAGQGAPVVVLAGDDDPVVPTQNDDVAVVLRPPRREDLLQALERVLPRG
jgi:CheY-like chemotaxis protein